LLLNNKTSGGTAMIDKKLQFCLFICVFFSLVFGTVSCTTIPPVAVEQQFAVDQSVFSHEYFDKVLQKYVNDDGMVNYRALQADQQDLETYYSLVATYSPDSHPELFPSEKDKLAYWINAYNGAVLKTVLTYYPIGSVLEVKTPALLFFLSDKAGFFFLQRLIFGGKTTSLYYLENKVIRPRFEEPRIHFALNCASLGCPRLPRTSFSGESLDQQLDRETRRFLAEERNFRIDHAERIIYLSEIFRWYEDDFKNWYRKKFPDNTESLLSYISLYLTSERAEALKKIGLEYMVHFTPYDWRLNDQN
jgi:hypothetical protein